MPSYSCLLSALLLIGELAAPAAAGFPYCLPGNACYPSREEWGTLNTTVGGRLIRTTPYGAPCYQATYNADECLSLAKSKNSLAFRDSLPGPPNPYPLVACSVVSDKLDSGSHVHELGAVRRLEGLSSAGPASRWLCSPTCPKQLYSGRYVQLRCQRYL